MQGQQKLPSSRRPSLESPSPGKLDFPSWHTWFCASLLAAPTSMSYRSSFSYLRAQSAAVMTVGMSYYVYAMCRVPVTTNIVLYPHFPCHAHTASWAVPAACISSVGFPLPGRQCHSSFGQEAWLLIPAVLGAKSVLSSRPQPLGARLPRSRPASAAPQASGWASCSISALRDLFSGALCC